MMLHSNHRYWAVNFLQYQSQFRTSFVTENFRLRNDLYCVEWGVKLYSLTHPSQKTHSQSHYKICYLLSILRLATNSARQIVVACFCIRLKAKAQHLCSATSHILQLQQRCTSETAVVQPRPKPRPKSQTLPYSHIAVRSPGLSFNGLSQRNPRKYINYYSFTDPGGMEG